MGNDMFNDEQLADAEVRAQASGFILSREAFLRRLHVLADTVANNDSLLPSEVDLSAHDAALRAEVERLKKALAACTERLRHLHGLRMEGEPKALDFSHEFALIRKARTANLSAPAEEEGRDE